MQQGRSRRQIDALPNRDVSHSFRTRQAAKGAGVLAAERCGRSGFLLPWKQSPQHGAAATCMGWRGSCLCPCAGPFLLPPRYSPSDSSLQSPASLRSPSLVKCASLPAEFPLYIRDLGLHLSLAQPSLNTAMMSVPLGGEWSLAQRYRVTCTKSEERQWQIKEFQKLAFIKALACPGSSACC